ncbi:MAG: hypothetical protein JWP88_310 [Flaviaesturariibacter sp.]|nr:hypothetical protein [Flaviaesturariibacter sp.]
MSDLEGKEISTLSSMYFANSLALPERSAETTSSSPLIGLKAEAKKKSATLAKSISFFIMDRIPALLVEKHATVGLVLRRL